jgi:hypothetical protein
MRSALILVVASASIAPPSPGAGAVAAIPAVMCPAGQSVSYHGTVVDRLTGVSLAGADVVLTAAPDPLAPAGTPPPREERVRSAGDGTFQFCDSRLAGTVRLQARFFGQQGDAVRLAEGDAARPVHLQVAAPHSVLEGRVRGPDGVAVPAAAVELSGTPIRATSGADGRFRIAQVPPGSYPLRVSHVGFATVSDSVTVEYAATAQVTVTLSVDAVALEPITVTTRAFQLDRVGFYTRQQQFRGVFITRDQIRDMPLRVSSDLMRSIPGVQVVQGGVTGNRVVGRLNCPFNYVVNGSPVGLGFELDEIAIDAIAALEIYRSLNEVPGEFAPLSSSRRGACGVIVIWTRAQ